MSQANELRNNLYAVILAGGSGTRFWPLSRRHLPKQFLKIIGKRSLFQETLRRIKPIVESSRIFIVTNADYRRQIREQLRGLALPQKNILLEPEGKNTAPAIGWAASMIHRRNPQTVMVILPSDHFISHPNVFLQNLRQAIPLAEAGYLVTLGIVPTRPETGYGYLETSPLKEYGKNVLKVEKFTEKPSLKLAQKFLKQKRYLWNSGMFLWKTEVILNAFAQYLPEMYRHLKKADGRTIKRIWPLFPSISVDYGILEKSNRVVAIAASQIGWSDLGSWQALWEKLLQDRQGNIGQGDHISINCQNTMVLAKDRLVVTIGLKDLTVVETPDAVLVCRTSESQKVKEVVARLENLKRREIE